MKYIFGPVFSRRLGISLGVDLVPYKVCSMDCLYCEVGKTSEKTLKRAEYVPFEAVKSELEEYLSFNPELDYITFSGYGEPTLYSKLGELVSWLKSNYNYPLALLTNSSLLHEDKVIEEIKDLNVVLPSLDAGCEETFKKLNRPVKGLTLEKIVEGIKKLMDATSGEVWLETVFVKDINDSDEEIEKIGKLVHEISPHRWQLNTVARPPAYNVKGLTYEELEEIKEKVGYPQTEIVARSKTARRKLPVKEVEKEIIALLSRRPCPASEIADALNLLQEEVDSVISKLLKEGRIIEINFGGEPYLKATSSG